jgi:hypothetical protein
LEAFNHPEKEEEKKEKVHNKGKNEKEKEKEKAKPKEKEGDGGIYTKPNKMKQKRILKIKQTNYKLNKTN